MSQLRIRMAEELRLRNYREVTAKEYLYAVARYARYFMKSPDELGKDDVRKYLLHLADERKLSFSSINTACCALRFFYRHVMEFIQRFLQHVLPDGFVRMRYYGFMANRNRSANIELCRKLIGASRYHEPNCVGVATAESEKRVICPKCGGQMINVREIIGVYRIRCRGRAP